jgi:hypothetical protein
MCAWSRSGRFVVNVPSGLITSMRSPGFRFSYAQTENRPPRSRLMPTLTLPGVGGRQIE